MSIRPSRFIIVILLAALVAPASAFAQNVKAGIDAWQKSDYARAVAIWRPLAEAGDADAQFNLAQAYRLGRGVPTNLAAAKSWFEKAATKGHVDAQTTLGLLLFQNGERPDGLKWLKAAAEQGEPRALLIYGTALYNGDSVVQDQVLGYAYISRAAAQGLAPAKETLAQLDKLMPLGDRKKGVAIARQKAKAAPPPVSRTKPVPSKEDVAAAKTAQMAAAKAKSKEAPARTTVPQVAATTASPPVASGAWRIQLGAFSQKGAAQALFGKVAGSLGGHQAYYIPVGAVTRLQVGPYASKADANAACARLKGQACFAVAAK